MALSHNKKIATRRRSLYYQNVKVLSQDGNSLAQAQYPLESCVLGKDKRDTGLGRFSHKYSSLISFLVGGWVDCLVVCMVAFLVDWLVGYLFFG